MYNEENVYWQTAKMYFKANQMGLLDPETYTQKNEDYSRKIGEGQILFSSMEWDFDASKCDEAKMKGIARLLNFVCSEDGARTIMNGPKGVTWDYDENGVAVFSAGSCNNKKESVNNA